MARRRNPLAFTISPEAQRQSDPRSRTAVSVYSPVKQRAVVERFEGTPHNWNVILSPRHMGSPEERAEIKAWQAASVRPDAVNLHIIGDPRPDPRQVDAAAVRAGTMQPHPRAYGESIYTPFNYMHRFGDEVGGKLLTGGPIPVYGVTVSTERAERPGGHGIDTKADPALVALTDALDRALQDLRTGFGGSSRNDRRWLLESLLASRVNSKAVREGYANEEGQAIADMFALAELTPPERPLLRPFEDFYDYVGHAATYNFGTYTTSLALRLGGGVGLLIPEAVEILNAYMVRHNVLWRAWHDRVVRSLYGAEVWL